mmetsp:Transcript_1873/g.4085  ORF Transcript_1873/g.4085 Transcript_1873/m.4085 type:complete len:1373 (-) Transcript_1873:163-4281(-)
MKFIKQKKAAAAAASQPPLSTSINSDNDALAMSYNDPPTREGVAKSSADNDEELTEDEAQKARKQSSFTSFISPAERKRRQQEKIDALNKKKEQDSGSSQKQQESPPAASSAADVEDEKSEISMTDSEKQRVEVVQRTSFISPMERKKRALERQKSLQAEEEAKNSNNNDNQQEDSGDVVTKTSSVSSSIAKFNQTFGKKDTKRSFNESLTKKADAVLHKKEPTSSDEQGASLLSADVPPTLSDIDAAVSAPSAQDPERTVLSESLASSTSSLVSASYPTPKESDREKAKRAAIQAVMKDTSLSPTEKNAKMQSIIRGNFEDPAASAAPATASSSRPPEAASLSSSTSSLVSASYPTPKESDREKAKRAAIQAVMKDTSLSPTEKNAKMQSIIRGNFEGPTEAAAVITPAVVTAASVTLKEEVEESSSGEEEEDDSSSGEYETSSGEEESSTGEYETTSEEEEEEEVEGEDGEETSSGEYESSSGEEESTTVIEPVVEPVVASVKAAPVVKPVKAAPEETSSAGVEEEEEEESVVVVESLKAEAAPEDTSVDQSTAGGSGYVSKSAAVAKEKSDLESKLDQELENHHALERQHEQRQAEFRAEQDRLRKAEAADAERLRLLEVERREEQRRLEEEQRLLEEERLRVEMEQQAAENERRRRLEEEGQRALELVQRRLQQDKEKQRALARQQEEQRQYEEQRRQLEEEQRRLEAEREHQQILDRQREQMLQLQEEQRSLEEQRIQFEEEQRRLREERVHEQVQNSRAVGNVDRTTTSNTRVHEQVQASRAVGNADSTTIRNTRPAPRSSPNKTISSSLPGGQRSRIPPLSRVAPVTSSSLQNTRYDGVDDDELNWRLDSYAMLSDYTIIVRRALPGPHAPDFEVDDANAIDFSMDAGNPKLDSYYVHKAMIAVGSRRSELLGRRIREADSTTRPDGHSSDVNVHETIMLESAADAMGIVLDFLYYPDKPLEMNIHNAVPLVYLGKRYRIRALIEQSEEFVHSHLESTNAIHFLLDSYLYQLDDILSRAIDVTAANLGATLDFNPIYQLPPELFRRIILSKDLNCDSGLLSLIVYSYCGEHHAEDIDVEYLREITKQRLMPEIDSKVALMLLKFYVDLIFADDENCDIMDVLVGDSLMQRCIAVAAKHWQGEVYEPLMVDSEFNESASPMKRRLPAHEPTAIHRALPTKLQNYLLEKCIIEAKNDFDNERAAKDAQQGEKQAEIEAVTKSCDAIVRELQNDLRESEKNKNKQNLKTHLDKIEAKMLEMEAELELQKQKAEAYKQELKRFRRVPGIHNFGEVCKKDPTVVDKTKCTYSGNPDHHYPLHRRGDRPPTQMPGMTAEFQNLAKENGYIYDDGHGGMLPVFYYVNTSASV